MLREQREMIINDMYINEKEEDHPLHMYKKEGHKDNPNINKNKKYKKDPKKADLIYKGREASEYQNNFNLKTKKFNTDDPKQQKKYESLKKNIDYIDDKGSKVDKRDKSYNSDYKKYKLSRKIFLNRMGKYDNGDMDISYDDKDKEVTAFNWNDTIKVNVSGPFYHCSNVKGLKVLKGVTLAPKNKVIQDKGDGKKLKSMRTYSNKRAYITKGKPDKTWGKYVYQLERDPKEVYAYKAHEIRHLMFFCDEEIPVKLVEEE